MNPINRYRRQRRERIAERNLSRPYPGRRGHRVETWIDAYWRTGELNMEFFSGGIFKLTEGKNYFTDEKRAWCLAALKQCVEMGKGISYYHYARPDTDPGDDGLIGDAVAEAEDFLAAIDSVVAPHTLRFVDGGTAAVWLDLEATCDNLSEEDGLAWILSWLEVVEERFPCGLYASSRWTDAEATPNGDESLQKLYWRKKPVGGSRRRPAWIARYGSNSGVPELQKYPHEEKLSNFLLERGPIAIKQFTSRMVTPGIAEPHDANLLYLA